MAPNLTNIYLKGPLAPLLSRIRSEELLQRNLLWSSQREWRGWERGSGEVSWTDSKNPLMASGSCPDTQWHSNVPTFPVIHIIVPPWSGVLVRELQRCYVLSVLLTEKTLNKKCSVNSVLNVLQLKGLGVVVSSECFKTSIPCRWDRDQQKDPHSSTSVCWRRRE